MNKKLFNILFLWLFGLGMMAQTDVTTHILRTSITPSKAGTVSVSDNEYQTGSSVWVYTYANEYYRFKCWKAGEEQVSTETAFYYTMPDKDVTLTAVYEYDPESPANPKGISEPHTLTLKASPSRGGYFSYTSGQKFNQGTTLEMYAYSNAHYQFKHWEYLGEVVSTDYRYVFTMPDEAAELVAVFSYNPASPSNPGSNAWNAATGELIVDEFQAGSLSNAISNLAGDNSLEKLVVAGKINDYDIGSLSGRGIKNADLSRCSGATAVPSWSFSDDNSLTEISLPASITSIGYGAFSNCSELTTVNCYAAIPPTLNENVFSGIKNQVIIFVPAESYEIYLNAIGWKDLNIRRMGAQVFAVEVDLPAETGSLYKNMFIELVNEQSEQVIRYLVTDRLAYTFKNLVPETTWTARLKNADGLVLGTIEHITIDRDLRVQLTDLIKPQTIRAEVLAGGTDVTSRLTLTWLHADGTYLGQGSTVNGILPLDGTKVILRITLPQTLAMEYQQPEDVVYSVQTDDNIVTTTLQALPKVQITGKVKDVTSGEPISNAVVTITQAKYNKAFSVKTNAQGVFAISDAYIASTDITVSATDYVGKTVSGLTLQAENGVAQVQDIALKSVNGAHINVNFTYTYSAEAGQAPETEEFFTDYLNVAYTIRDLTTGQTVKQFVVKGKEIILQEELSLGDNLQLTATSKTGAFEPLTATGQIDANNRVGITFDIKQLGQIRASYVSNENPEVTGILYDAQGKYVRSKTYEGGNILFTEVPDGRYTLVVMGNHVLFNSIYDLSKFAESGLTKGTDYAAVEVTVESGLISVVKTPYVPYLDIKKFQFMGDGTTFTVNKTLVTVGNSLTITGQFDVKSNFANALSDVKLVVDLPEACSLVEGSVMEGNRVVGYQYSDSRLIVPVSNVNNRIRFCIKPTKGGNFAPSALVQFSVDDQQMSQPIGSVTFKAENMSISVPATVATDMVPVSGTASPRAIVKVFDDDILIGLTMALANGNWSTSCQMVNPENGSTHNIYAEIISQDGETSVSETQTVLYKEQEVQIKTITMLNTAHPATSLALHQYTTIFDFLNPFSRLSPYWYWPDYPDFTFLIDFDHNEAVNADDWELIVFTSNNTYSRFKITWNKKKNRFVATSKFYYYALPISVNIHRKKDTSEPRMFRRVEYVLDPSGYVYEGVPSNRLEGVTSTIYYKDNNEVVHLWNARDYDQENPMFTDEYGMYAWDVPEGTWQVKFEKEGYETAYSEWLPVPPPQLKVNIPMTQLTSPVVNGATADEEGIEIRFNKYMKSETLTTDNIIVTHNDEMVRGSVELLDAEHAVEDDETSPILASKVRFKFNETFGANGQVHLWVNTAVKSNADIALAEAYQQDLDIQTPVKTISVDSLLAVEYEGTRTLKVSTLPVGAAAGKMLRAKVLSTTIAGISEDDDADGLFAAELDENGQASMTISGDLPGSTAVQFSIDDSDVSGQTLVKVQQVKSLVSNAPTASYATGSDLYRGSLVNLSSDDDNAKIYYTMSTNGVEPEAPTTSSTLYTAPIAIEDNKVIIKAIAQSEGFEQSPVATFVYRIKKNVTEINIVPGWTWLSHNLSTPLQIKDFSSINSILEVKSQAKGVVRDEVFGLFGNLSQMTALEGYKLRANASTILSREGDAFNANNSVVNLKAGWNWVGYPLKSSQTVNVALANLSAYEGDIIVGLEHSAEFIDGAWIGDLESIEPGYGYMMKVAQTGDLLYNTAVAQKIAPKSRGRLNINNSPWSVEAHRYADVMPLRAQLFSGESPAETDAFTVAAFKGSECRGIGTYVQGVIFMNIHGEAQENITFLAASNTSDDIFDITETLTFKADNVGSFKAPYALHLDRPSDGIKEHNALLGVSPAVATTQVEVSLGGKPLERLTLTNMDGKTVYLSTSGAARQTIEVGSLPAGIYIVAAQSGGETYYQKIVKVNK